MAKKTDSIQQIANILAIPIDDISQGEIQDLHKFLNKERAEARLVELDLFEQFLNRQTWSPKPLEDCYDYKLARLIDLETRLDKEE